MHKFNYYNSVNYLREKRLVWVGEGVPAPEPRVAPPLIPHPQDSLLASAAILTNGINTILGELADLLRGKGFIAGSIESIYDLTTERTTDLVRYVSGAKPDDLDLYGNQFEDIQRKINNPDITPLEKDKYEAILCYRRMVLLKNAIDEIKENYGFLKWQAEYSEALKELRRLAPTQDRNHNNARALNESISEEQARKNVQMPRGVNSPGEAANGESSFVPDFSQSNNQGAFVPNFNSPDVFRKPFENIRSQREEGLSQRAISAEFRRGLWVEWPEFIIDEKRTSVLRNVSAKEQNIPDICNVYLCGVSHKDGSERRKYLPDVIQELTENDEYMKLAENLKLYLEEMKKNYDTYQLIQRRNDKLNTQVLSAAKRDMETARAKMQERKANVENIFSTLRKFDGVQLTNEIMHEIGANTATQLWDYVLKRIKNVNLTDITQVQLNEILKLIKECQKEIRSATTLPAQEKLFLQFQHEIDGMLPNL
jgi:hypothetical protein